MIRFHILVRVKVHYPTFGSFLSVPDMHAEHLGDLVKHMIVGDHISKGGLQVCGEPKALLIAIRRS